MSTVESKVEEKVDLTAGFANAYESFEDAKIRKEEEEAGNKSKTNYFKTTSNGLYEVKVLPLNPKTSAAGWKGYSIPSNSIWLSVDKPDSSSKSDKPSLVKVASAKKAGFTVDVISEYKYLAIAQLKSDIESASGRKKDALEKKLKMVDGSSFNGGLRFDYKHLMYVIDINERKEGLKLYETPHSVYKGIEEAKMGIWGKRVKKNKNAPCPVTGISPEGLSGSNIVMITKSKPAFKTEYSVMLDTESDMVELTNAELSSLMGLPQLTDFLKYDKRQFQATLLFLKQYDAKNSLNITEDEKFIETVEKLKAELDAIVDDKSSFDFNKSSNDGGEEGGEFADGFKLDDLLDEYDQLVKDGIKDKTDEMNDFRKKLRQYVSQEGIPNVKIGKRNATEDAVQAIEDFISENGERGIVSAEEEEVEEPVVAPKAKRAKRAKNAPVVEEEVEEEIEEAVEEDAVEEEEAVEEDEEVEEEKEVAPHRTRARRTIVARTRK